MQNNLFLVGIIQFLECVKQGQRLCKIIADLCENNVGIGLYVGCIGLYEAEGGVLALSLKKLIKLEISLSISFSLDFAGKSE